VKRRGGLCGFGLGFETKRSVVGRAARGGPDKKGKTQ